jgi:hypothetical protein
MKQKAVTRSGQVIISQPVCTDDFGTLVYRCFFTKKFTWADTARFVGPFIQIPGTYVCHPNSKVAQQVSRRAFDEMEANCNTCIHFKRLPHTKDRSGLVRGSCDKVGNSKGINIYRLEKDEFWVPPEDPMHMRCWKGRQKIRIRLVDGLWYPYLQKEQSIPKEFNECLDWTHKRNVAEGRLTT